ncbi:tyrosine-type recombinase/integrase [Chitinibacter tainanensis]|uniref:tyrosine-type recombinase/integrase n=1 Tax=Chitinibacter tainanensis TaxID=230667 RepID=UPI0004051C6D|nr:site-specific integrase [Chitinibacter tainanensis]
MAKAYREGKTWSFRLRLKGQDIYRIGFPTEAAANQAQAEIRQASAQSAQPSGSGPFCTTLGRAFMQYAKERLPSLKGADKDANRINRYLRPLGLPTIQLEKLNAAAGSSIYWKVSFVGKTERVIPNSLKTHRAKQEERSSESQRQRAALAGMNMSDVTSHHVQQLIDAMKTEGKGAATIDHERAELRRLFSYARKIWNWRALSVNPASDVIALSLDSKRDRILSNDECRKMFAALHEYGNPYAVPLVWLMLETGMRSCEPLTYANWGCVNWTRRILELPDSKTGQRNVPLGPGAMTVLKMLAERAGHYAPDDPIFPTTYEAIKKAWATSRKQCGVEGVNLHDLRHTAATRYALEFKGDLPVIMQITGHKTIAMVMRYINIKVDDVVNKLHGEELDVGSAPAGYKQALQEAIESKVLNASASNSNSARQRKQASQVEVIAPTNSDNVISVNFGKAA